MINPKLIPRDPTSPTPISCTPAPSPNRHTQELAEEIKETKELGGVREEIHGVEIPTVRNHQGMAGAQCSKYHSQGQDWTVWKKERCEKGGRKNGGREKGGRKNDGKDWLRIIRSRTCGSKKPTGS